MKIRLFGLFFLLFTPFLSLQSNDLPPHFYLFRQNNIEDFCWSKNDKKASNTEIPEKYKNESAVILLSKTIYEIKTTSIGGRGISCLNHFRIKIQDQAALDNFSEIYFSDYSHGLYTLYDWVRQKNYLKIKLIKPDGSEIIIDDKEIIEEDDNKKKMAVPGLEIGDIVDYYSFTYDYIYHQKPSWYLPRPDFYPVLNKEIIANQYPILYFKYDIITDKHWKVRFTAGKSGLNIIESRKGKKDRDFHFTIEKEDIPRMESELWNYPYRTSPFVKLLIKYEKNHLTNASKEGGKLRTETITNDEIIEHYKEYYNKYSSAANEYRKFERYLKKNNKTNLSKKNKLEEYYYFLRHHFTNMHLVYDNFNNSGYSNHRFQKVLDSDENPEQGRYRRISDKEFSYHIIYGLKKLNIPFELIICEKRNMGTIDEIFHIFETNFILKVEFETPVFFYTSTPFTGYDQFPYIIEGTDGYILYKSNTTNSKLDVDTRRLSSSQPEDNISIFKTKLVITDKPAEKLIVNTEATHKGYSIHGYKGMLIDWIDLTWKENDLYDTKKWGKHEDENDKFNLQIEEYVSDQANLRKKNYESYAKNHFDIYDDLELIDYECVNSGNTIGNYDLQFKFSCEIDNILKKVGQNYILKLGSLIGGQITLDEEDMERTIDIYMDYPRAYDYTVEIEIPKGYEVKGLENLNLNIVNSAGLVKSSAELKDNLLTFKFKKQYNNNFEKAENWHLMKEFLIPASLIQSKEVLLKKL